jgi:hypothetical protein
MGFTQWLRQQVERNDIVGDLASDAQQDTRRKPRTRAGWERFLTNAGACSGAHEALRVAWGEYEAALVDAKRLGS